MSQFEPIEDQLRESLRRVQPPAGLEQRILARTAARASSPGSALSRRWLSVAASVVLVVSAGSYGLHQRRQTLERERAEQARQQLVEALKITTRYLAKADYKLRAIGVERIEIKEVER